MWKQPHDVVAYLGFDLRAHRLLFGVRRTGEQEVLPGEHALLVADVVKIVTLVNAAAPDPEQIDVGACGLEDSFLVARSVDPVHKGVIGNPVGPLDEHRSLIDQNREWRSRFVRRGVDSHRAEADATSPGITRDSLAFQHHIEIVERVLAMPDRPPALGVVDHDARLGDGLSRLEFDGRGLGPHGHPSRCGGGPSG